MASSSSLDTAQRGAIAVEPLVNTGQKAGDSFRRLQPTVAAPEESYLHVVLCLGQVVEQGLCHVRLQFFFCVCVCLCVCVCRTDPTHTASQI